MFLSKPYCYKIYEAKLDSLKGINRVIAATFLSTITNIQCSAQTVTHLDQTIATYRAIMGS